MNKKVYLILLISILAMIHPIMALAAKTKSMSSGAVYREQLIITMQKCILLNNEFKKSVGREPFNEQRRRSQESSAYYESELLPKLKDIVQIVSSGHDIDLAFNYFQFLISYENSADENISYSLGEMFLRNPDVIEQALKKLDKKERQYILQVLIFGFENIISVNSKDKRIPERKQRLERLKSKLGIRTS